MDKKQLLQKTYQAGFEFEAKYGACSQCVLAALAETLGGIDDSVLKSSTALAAGGALTGQGTCGALAGGMMAISLRYGRDGEQFKTQPVAAETWVLSKKLYDKFVSEFKSPICAGAQETVFGRSYNLLDKDDFKAFEEAGGHTDKCPDVVGKTAMWTAEILLEAEGESA